MFHHQSGQYLEIDGAKIYYEETGSKDKPVLLFLHGGFQSVEDLNSLLAPRLADFRIIGVDSRGHGKSTSGKQALTYERIQLDVEALLKHLKIDTVNILGFSDGAVVALRMAACKNVTVKKLIAIGTSWCLDDVVAVEDMYQEINPASAKEIFATSYAAYQKLNPEPDFDALTQSLIGLWLDKTATGQPNESVKAIAAEVLIIRGDKDFLVSLASSSQLAGEIEHSAFLNVPFADHVVYEDQATICEIAIKQFLEVSR